ncbi:MAG: hypothetical protein H7Z41_11055 [Cytophagales bacterium]|nr:hypothetical protein [Armatimonadota bacterium]
MSINRNVLAFGLCLLTTSMISPLTAAQAQAPPAGWKDEQKNGLRFFVPPDLAPGEKALILVFPPEPLGAGGDLESWMKKRIAANNAGKNARVGKITSKATDGITLLLATATVAGQPCIFASREAGGNGYLFLLGAGNRDLLVRYSGAFANTIRGAASGTAAGSPGGGAVPKVRASTGPLPAASLGGARIFVKYRISYGTSMTTNFDHLILFPDGSAFDDLPSKPMPRFDAATLRTMLKPFDIGRWKQTGNTLTLSFPNDKSEPQRVLRKHPKGWWDDDGPIKTDTAYDTYYPVIVPTSKQVLGPWKSQSLTTMGTMGGGAPMVAAGSNSDLQFRADGTFTNAKKSFASSTTANMGDGFKSGGDVGIYSNSAKNAAGRWRLDGVLLTMERDGQRSVKVAFIMPNWSKEKPNSDLMIDGDWWERPEK